MAMVIQRFNVVLVNLDPTIGSEIRKTRPAVVISPDSMNRHIRTVIIAPITSKRRAYPTRVQTAFQGRQGQIVLDQIRTVDKSRLIKRLGCVGHKSANRTLAVLQEIFAP
jgi:mRNA interferase MazF